MGQSASKRLDLSRRLQVAMNLLRDEQLEKADVALDAILSQWPGEPNALHFQGILRHTQGRSAEGVALIRQALEALPKEPGLWNNLGNVLVESQQLDQAVEAYRASVAAAPGLPASADALNNLGTVLRRQLDWPAAEQAYRDALALRPDFVNAWYNLSITLLDQGRVPEGLEAKSRAIALSPRDLQPLNQVIRALLLLGERDQAAQLYREWLATEPDNPVAQHQLAACLGHDTPARASDAYVEEVFDSFSSSFDVKLEQLGYRAPSLVAEALQQATGEPAAALDICDAGCGTGLCGPLLRPWARKLAGCDLSVGMLRQAKPRRCYDALHKAELVHYLQTQPSAFDAVVSADTLCYFGPLEQVAAAATNALRPGGWLIFTVEALPDGCADPHQLQTNGRYAHESGYLRRVLAAAGFAQPLMRHDRLRMEGGRPVMGWLVTARRSEFAA
jgi:predicted TPR repeat methyltransferase